MFVGHWFHRLSSGSIAALAVSIVVAGTPLPVRADEATTHTESTGSASAEGPGGSVAGMGTENSSTASSNRKGAYASSEGWSTSAAVQSGGTSSATQTHAKASAKSTRKKLEAYAEAGAWTAAAAVGKDGLAAGLSGNYGKAYARSSKKSVLAYAESVNGGIALAISNRKGKAVTTTSVPNGLTYTYHKGHMTYSVSYTELGSFSLAMVRGWGAHAMTGTTENVGALTSGNIKAILHSSMMAESYADRTTAYARASAHAGSYAETATSRASSNGSSYAFAQVTRSIGKVTVKVTDISRQCRDFEYRRNAAWNECQLKLKPIRVASAKRLKKKTAH